MDRDQGQALFSQGTGCGLAGDGGACKEPGESPARGGGSREQLTRLQRRLGAQYCSQQCRKEQCPVRQLHDPGGWPEALLPLEVPGARLNEPRCDGRDPDAGESCRLEPIEDRAHHDGYESNRDRGAGNCATPLRVEQESAAADDQVESERSCQAGYGHDSNEQRDDTVLLSRQSTCEDQVAECKSEPAEPQHRRRTHCGGFVERAQHQAATNIGRGPYRRRLSHRLRLSKPQNRWLWLCCRCWCSCQ